MMTQAHVIFLLLENQSTYHDRPHPADPTHPTYLTYLTHPTYLAGMDVYAITAIFQRRPSRTSVN